MTGDLPKLGAGFCDFDCFIGIFNFQSPSASSSDVPSNNQANVYSYNPNEAVDEGLELVENQYQGTRYIHYGGVKLLTTLNIPDIALLEFNEPIPPQFDVEFAGWSAYTPIFGVPIIDGYQYGRPPYLNISHPSADIKKAMASAYNASIFSVGLAPNADAAIDKCYSMGNLVDGVLTRLSRLFGGGRVRAGKYPCVALESVAGPFLLPEGYNWDVPHPEGGSSGSGLYNHSMVLDATSMISSQYIGAYSFSVPFSQLYLPKFTGQLHGFSKFRVLYHLSRKCREELGTQDRFGADLLPSGRFTCYPHAVVQRNFWPLSDIQPHPHHKEIRFSTPTVTLQDVKAFPGSEYTLKASEAFELKGVTSATDLRGNGVDLVIDPHVCLDAGLLAPPIVYPDSSWYDPAVRQAFADSACITLAEFDSLYNGEVSPAVYQKIRNCQNIDITNEEWENYLDMAAERVCLTKAQLDSVLTGNYTEELIYQIINCPKLDTITGAEIQYYLDKYNIQPCLTPLEYDSIFFDIATPELWEKLKACYGLEDSIEIRKGKPEPANPNRIQVYPNPFGSAFTIHLETRAAGPLSLTVYDVQGRPIAQPLSGAWLEAGAHSYAVAAENWPAGVYSLVLRAGDNVATHRLVKQ